MRGTIIGIGVVAAIVLVVYLLFQLDEWDSSMRPHGYLPPCGYGAIEIMVHEQDGQARVVCGCRRSE